MVDAVAPLAFALSATIAIELPLAALLFGVRRWRALLVVTLAQVATNPAVELVCLWVRWNPRLNMTEPAWGYLFLAECAAVVVEALLYRRAAVSRHPWLMSLALNALSFTFGLLMSLAGR